MVTNGYKRLQCGAVIAAGCNQRWDVRVCDVSERGPQEAGSDISRRHCVMHCLLGPDSVYNSQLRELQPHAACCNWCEVVSSGYNGYKW